MIKNQKQYLAQGKVINNLDAAIEIKMTKDKGRGVFSTKFMKKGHLISVEKALTEA